MELSLGWDMAAEFLLMLQVAGVRLGQHVEFLLVFAVVYDWQKFVRLEAVLRMQLGLLS